jgi:hypothetical protein
LFRLEINKDINIEVELETELKSIVSFEEKKMSRRHLSIETNNAVLEGGRSAAPSTISVSNIQVESDERTMSGMFVFTLKLFTLRLISNNLHSIRKVYILLQ